MNVREEIEKYAAEADKPVLRWLFERNHWESQWNYVAGCEIRNPTKRFMCGYRVWSPKPAGRNQYEAEMMRELLKSAPCTCTEVNGIGLICHADDNPKCFKNQAKAFLSKEGT